MIEIVWKTFKTEKGAIKYANKIANEHNVILGVEFVGGLYYVGA
jgi:hypothetical protein